MQDEPPFRHEEFKLILANYSEVKAGSTCPWRLKAVFSNDLYNYISFHKIQKFFKSLFQNNSLLIDPLYADDSSKLSMSNWTKLKWRRWKWIHFEEAHKFSMERLFEQQFLLCCEARRTPENISTYILLIYWELVVLLLL